MTFQAWFAVAVAGLCLLGLAQRRGSPDVVMVGGVTLLLVAGVLTPEEALSGLANEGVVTVAVLYVVVSGLSETGAVGWIVRSVLGRPRGLRHGQMRLMAPVAVLSAFLNNTPVVALFIPAVREWARRHRLSLSRFMIPLSFASIAGGTCTLIGTSTNLVVNGMLVESAGGAGLTLFEPAWVGVPVVVTVLLYLLAFGRWLLPERVPVLDPSADARQYTTEMTVEPDSPLVGRSIEEAGLRQLPGLFLMEVERQGEVLAAVAPHTRLHARDRLVFVGVLDSIVDLHHLRGLQPAGKQVFKLDCERGDRHLVEAVVSDSCPVVGKTVREGRFRTRYSAVIIAVARNGQRVPGKIGDVVLRPGDTLLLEARPSFLEQQRNSRDFYLVSPLRDHLPVRYDRALVALAITGTMVGSVALGWLSMLPAAMLAAGLMILTRCTRGRIARRAVDWQVLVVIAAAFGIGAALEKTGAARVLAESLVALAGGEPWTALALVFAATAVLTALATNNAAAVLMFPIAWASAQRLGVDALPFAVTIMVAASASFATPIGYQTNLMVYGVGGYRFSDFVRVGLPLTVLVGAVTVGLVPWIWRF